MDKLKLKSKTLIKYFKKDTITAKELEKMEKFILNENGEKIDKQEAELFQEDLYAIFKAIPNIKEIQLNGIDMGNISIPKILKESPISEISFDDSDKYFIQLVTNKVKISELMKEKNFLYKKDKISEFDVFEALKIFKKYHGFPTVEVEDLELVLKYIDISEIRIKVRTQSDVDKIEELAEKSKTTLVFDTADLKNIEKIPKSFSVDVSIHDMSELGLDDIENLEKKFNLSKVLIQHKMNRRIDKYYELPKKQIEKYNIEMYKKLRKEIDLITEGINKEGPEIERFLNVYKRLGKKIFYDWEYRNELDADNNFSIGDYPPAHNLIGGLITNTCVCEGYAKILKQALSCVNIQSEIICGKLVDKEYGHAWNQVKIDETWYNVDLTWDADKIKENRELDYCLQSDSEFINHGVIPYTAKKCRESFNRNKMNKYLGIPFAFDFEEKDYAIADVISLIQELNSCSTKGTRIGIKKDSTAGDYKMYLGNIIENDYIKWSENKITLDTPSLVEFLVQYAENFNIKNKGKIGTVGFTKTQESTELIIDESFKTVMKDYGIDMDKLLTPRKEKDNSLVKYKISIWSRIMNSFKSKLKNMKKNLFKEEKIKENKKAEHLPSWDLKNWKQDRSEFYAAESKKEKMQKDEREEKEEYQNNR